MKRLEATTHRRIHELFDYVCGVSTGALIAVMAGVFRVPLDDTELLYKVLEAFLFFGFLLNLFCAEVKQV